MKTTKIIFELKNGEKYAFGCDEIILTDFKDSVVLAFEGMDMGAFVIATDESEMDVQCRYYADEDMTFLEIPKKSVEYVGTETFKRKKK